MGKSKSIAAFNNPDEALEIFREIYLNRIYKNESDVESVWHIVVVDARPFSKLWTSFIPATLDYINTIQSRRETGSRLSADGLLCSRAND